MKMPFFIPLVLALAMAMAGGGCALRFTDRNGHVQTVGLLWQTTPAAATGTTKPVLQLGPVTDPDPPRWLQVRTVGLSLERTPQTGGISLGYRDSIWVLPREEAITIVESESNSNEPPRVTTIVPAIGENLKH